MRLPPEIVTLGRALEDTQIAVQQSLADRDAADDDLDLAAQNASQGPPQTGTLRACRESAFGE